MCTLVRRAGDFNLSIIQFDLHGCRECVAQLTLGPLDQYMSTLNFDIDALGHVAEGVGTTDRMVELGRSHGLATPIAQAVQAVLAGVTSPRVAIDDLMGRRLKGEYE